MFRNERCLNCATKLPRDSSRDLGHRIVRSWKPQRADSWHARPIGLTDGPDPDVSRGLDYHGNAKIPVHMFGDYHTWRPDESDVHIMRIRKTDAYTRPFVYE